MRSRSPLASRSPGDSRPARTATKAALRRGRKSSVEESAEVRHRIYSAAAEIVGKVGYAEASIALITQKANVAQGTFYRYFKSRQDMLDKLLPDMGQHMLEHVRKHAVGGHGFAELEERAFRAFFSFLRENPSFLRILNEAESFAPKGYLEHFALVSKGYVKFLRRSLADGKFPKYGERELETIAYMLMAARSYLALRYLGVNGKGKLPEGVVDTYIKFTLYGLQGIPQLAATPVRQRARSTDRAEMRASHRDRAED